MPKVDVVDLGNNVVGSIELADEVFGAEVNEGLIYQAVHHYRAGQRAGTHKTKVRSEVRGGGRKPWRQKGTGRARAGSTRSPLWRSGGTVHGPQPRDYSYHLPRKMTLGALRSALSARLADGDVKIVKDFELASSKTKEFSQVLARLQTRESVLLIDDEDNDNLRLSCRNIPGVTLMGGHDIHPYHLLGHKSVIISEATAVKCCEVLG